MVVAVRVLGVLVEVRFDVEQLPCFLRHKRRQHDKATVREANAAHSQAQAIGHRSLFSRRGGCWVCFIRTGKVFRRHSYRDGPRLRAEGREASALSKEGGPPTAPGPTGVSEASSNSIRPGLIFSRMFDVRKIFIVIQATVFCACLH